MNTSSQQSPTGMNRTGIGMSPLHSAALIKATEQASTISGDASDAAELRKEYSTASEPIGSMPPPSSMKGVAKAAVGMIEGRDPSLLLDKLGERLAFERTGSRAYEALLVKFDASQSWPGGPTRPLLEQFHADELRHFALLRDRITEIGGDPTAMTPSADIVAVESIGLLQVLGDPRTSLAQGVHAMLVAELVDQDGWSLLIELARRMGQPELANAFLGALEEEQLHTQHVREWLRNHLMC